jgi:glucose/arabinose dehydrogenase
MLLRGWSPVFSAALALVLPLQTSSSSAIHATALVSGLSSPVGFIQNPFDATMQVIIEQGGRLRLLKDGSLRSTDFLNLSNQIAFGGEQGLLGFAFAPDYPKSGRVFASFTNPAGNAVIARFVRSASDPLRIDPSSRFDLMWPDGNRFITHPFTNHNGGNIIFGPDGYLYYGMGDGGSGNDPFNNAQNPQSLLGKMIRIDVSVPDSDPRGYSIPASNPFVGRPGFLGEIWDLGMRNPWRWSFDNGRNGTKALVIGDVGQDSWEEVDYEPAAKGGRNYGWRDREGAHDNITSPPPSLLPLRDPIAEYSHSVGLCIIGGYVYRGLSLGPALNGQYFFGDNIKSRIWSMPLSIDAATGEATAGTIVEHTAELGSAAASPSSFGVDAAGELYVVSYLGTIYKLDGSGATGGRHRPGEASGTAKPRGE